MKYPSEPLAWLEFDGKSWPIVGSCSLGRSSTNQIVFSSAEISRRHAIIHVQDQNEFWLVDLGTLNGTYLNDHRVVQPTRLRDGDRIRVVQYTLTFRQPSMAGAIKDATSETKPTLPITQTTHCWLLVVDIVESHKLLQSQALDQLAQEWGSWFSECKRIIQQHHGSINKFLGDGFLAYWHDRENIADAVAKALQELTAMQSRQMPVFLMALHHGKVGIGALPSMGEESLLGEEVYFVFRIEEVAKQLKQFRLASEQASRLLEGKLPLKEVGRYPLHGFPEAYSLFGFQ
jgi:class 3 adenylate cyclase